MSIKLLALAGVLFWNSVVHGQAYPEMQVASVSVTDRAFVDESRSNWNGDGPRRIGVTIWYPATIHMPTEINEDTRRGENRYPLIMISHGAQSQARDMQWLGDYLASRGYIAAAVNHNGSAEEERKLQHMTLSDFCMWVRPKDISVALDGILRDSLFGWFVDTSRVGAAGFSLGGATAIWVAGARFDIHNLGRHAPKPPEHLEADIARFVAYTKTDPVVKRFMTHSGDDYHDPRIKAVFALAPAIGQGFTKKGLKSIHVPVQVAVGEEDIIAPMSTNAAHYTRSISTALPLIVLPGERGHYTRPSGDGNSHVRELEEVSEITYDFFEGVFGKK